MLGLVLVKEALSCVTSLSGPAMTCNLLMSSLQTDSASFEPRPNRSQEPRWRRAGPPNEKTLNLPPGRPAEWSLCKWAMDLDSPYVDLI